MNKIVLIVIVLVLYSIVFAATLEFSENFSIKNDNIKDIDFNDSLFVFSYKNKIEMYDYHGNLLKIISDIGKSNSQKISILENNEIIQFCSDKGLIKKIIDGKISNSIKLKKYDITSIDDIFKIETDIYIISVKVIDINDNQKLSYTIDKLNIKNLIITEICRLYIDDFTHKNLMSYNPVLPKFGNIFFTNRGYYINNQKTLSLYSYENKLLEKKQLDFNQIKISSKISDYLITKYKRFSFLKLTLPEFSPSIDKLYEINEEIVIHPWEEKEKQIIENQFDSTILYRINKTETDKEISNKRIYTPLNLGQIIKFRKNILVMYSDDNSKILIRKIVIKDNI